MKNNGTIAAIGITAAVTVVAAMTAPSVIHQIAVFAGGTFALIGALAVCVALNIGEEKYRSTSRYLTAEEKLAQEIRAYRASGWDNKNIARVLGVDIDVVSTIK